MSSPWTSRWRTTVATTLAALGLVIGAAVAVDPYGVWGTPVVPGFNNAKRGQYTLERMFKPYQAVSQQPSVVLLGSSRVDWCFPAEWPGTPDAQVYNLAYQGARMPELEATVDMVLARWTPEVIAIGLDVDMFDFTGTHDAFSPERLAWAAEAAPVRLSWQLRESALTLSTVPELWEVVRASRADPDLLLYERGYRAQIGRLPGPQATSWAKYLQQGLAEGQIKGFAPSKLASYRRLARKVQEAGVTLVPFFVPVHADLLMTYALGRRDVATRSLKSSLTEIAPLWDFQYVSDVTTDRRRFRDPSHCLEPVGRKVIARIAGAEDDDGFGVLLTPDNLKAALHAQERRYADWEGGRIDLRDALDEARDGGPRHYMRFIDLPAEDTRGRRRDIPDE